MADKIDINSAPVGILTQLPGVAKNVAYNIVNHRTRHGFFTAWEELAEVKDFPIEQLDKIRERAVLTQGAEGRPTEVIPAPRRLTEEHIAGVAKGTKGYTRKMRTTRRPDRLHDSHDHTHRDGAGKKSA